MERRRVRFSGRVQGVGFRATARHVARGRAVSGWVRNEDDGTVTLEVQGETARVEEFLAALRDAMAGRIAAEDAAAVPAVGGEREFEIRR